jgi:hypothetical protein
VPRPCRPHESEEDEDARHDSRAERRNHHLESNTPGPAGPFTASAAVVEWRREPAPHRSG